MVDSLRRCPTLFAKHKSQCTYISYDKTANGSILRNPASHSVKPNEEDGISLILPMAIVRLDTGPSDKIDVEHYKASDQDCDDKNWLNLPWQTCLLSLRIFH